ASYLPAGRGLPRRGGRRLPGGRQPGPLLTVGLTGTGSVPYRGRGRPVPGGPRPVPPQVLRQDDARRVARTRLAPRLGEVVPEALVVGALPRQRHANAEPDAR